MRLLTAIISFCLFSIFLVNPAFAQDSVGTTVDSATSSAEIDSYTLFWPLTPGKTEGDSLYSLKLFKEKIGGLFMFGDMKKADYSVYLGTKRVMETEKLLKDNKTDLAIKTLRSADSEFSSAYNHVKSKAASGKVSKDEIRRDRLLNLKTLIDQLKTSAPEGARQPLEAVKVSIDRILGDFLP